MNYITHNGVKHPVRFSYKAIKRFMLETGLLFADFEAKMIMHMDTLLFHGLKVGYKLEDKKFNFTIDDVSEWFEEDMSLITDVSTILANDMSKIEKKMMPARKSAKP